MREGLSSSSSSSALKAAALLFCRRRDSERGGTRRISRSLLRRCVCGERGNPPPSSIHKLCDRSCLSGVEWGKKKGDREETLEGTLRVCSSSSSSSTSDGFAENEEEEKREEIKQTDESIRDSKGKKTEGERKIGKRWCSVLLESVRAEEKKKRPYPSRIKSDFFVSFLLLKVR